MLRADCERCFGLCCVVPGFAASADFPIDKPARRPCHHLAADFRCSIHDALRPRGFVGCTVYDCFGAGQKVSQETFAGQDWRDNPEIAEPMFAAFEVVRELHELLWYLAQARRLPQARECHEDIEAAREKTRRLADSGPRALAELDVRAHWAESNDLLVRVSAQVRGRGRNLQRADLVGKDFRGADLRRATFRGAYLIGADLRGADLRLADLIGADLRGADLSGADLGTSLFVTQPQLDAAKGDGATVVPPSLARPRRWAA
jgi:uncharacterized protein YjbI with pentapeptide repeats